MGTVLDVAHHDHERRVAVELGQNMHVGAVLIEQLQRRAVAMQTGKLQRVQRVAAYQRQTRNSENPSSLTSLTCIRPNLSMRSRTLMSLRRPVCRGR